MTSIVDSKEVGLVAGLKLFHFFLGSGDLHDRLWRDDLEVCVHYLPAAALEQAGPNFKPGGYAFRINHPWLAKIINWKYDLKIRKMNHKCMSGGRNAKSIARFKLYRLLPLRMLEQ